MKTRYVAIACILAIFVTASLLCLLCDGAMVQAADLSVTTVDATNITESTAALNGELTGLGTSGNVTVSFEWGPQQGGTYPNLTTQTPMIVAGYFSASLSGLSPDTAYHFRAVAYGDELIYGDNKMFFTNASGIPAVTTNDATSITDTTAILNGDLTDLGISDNVTVRFQWGTSDGYGFLTATQLTHQTGTFSTSLSDLSLDTTYHFRAVAYGDGTSYGSDETFTTKAGPVSLTVITDDATSVTATGAILNGNLTDLGISDNVTVSFEWGTNTSYGTETTPETMTTTGSFNASLSSLSPGTTYHFRAKAFSDQASYGGDKTLNMVADPPGITTSAATNITASSVTLNGKLTTLGTSASVTTSFEWGTTQGGPYANQTTPETMTTTGALNSSLTGLDSDTTYYFRAKAIGHETSYGSEFSFQPKAEAVQAPAGGDEGSIFGDLDWPVIAAVAGGALLLIVLLLIVARLRTRPAGGTQRKTQQWAQQGTHQGGIRQQTPEAQQTYGCPTCSAAIAFGSNPCPNCGTGLNWGSQQTSSCPICGAAIAFGSNPCPTCGTGLDWHM